MPAVLSYFKTPLTDLTGTIANHQYFGRCQELEMRVVNCLEAYGKITGKQKCADLLSDFEECNKRFKQMSRFLAIQNEREKQGVYEAPPRGDAYLYS